MQEISEFPVYNPYNYLYFITIFLLEIRLATEVCEIALYRKLATIHYHAQQ